MIKIFNFPEHDSSIIVTNGPYNNKYSVIVFNGICGIKKRFSRKIIDNALSLGVFNWMEKRTGRTKLALVSIYEVDEISTTFPFKGGMRKNIMTKLKECGLLS